jgi:nicotinamide mononucleotide transporter
MWLMTKKKFESWVWWLATNIASVPLYFIKGYVFTSVQFVILFIINIVGMIEWYRKAKEHRTLSKE